jgi:hypothetical protein
MLGGEVFAYTPLEGKITGSIGPMISKTNFASSSTGAHAVDMGGVGLIANGDINDHGSLEIAMIHSNKLFFRQKDTQVMGEETQVFHITMGYRRWLGEHFSVAMAFYSAYSMGDPTVVHNDFPAGKEIDTSARDSVEYGLDFSLQSELITWSNSSILLDLRYAASGTNKDSESGDHYGGLLLYKWVVQEGHKLAP